jgi:hypothetical protein
MLIALHEAPRHDETDHDALRDRRAVRREESRTGLTAPRRAARLRAMSPQAPPEYPVKARNMSSTSEKAIPQLRHTAIYHLPAIG